MSDFNIGSIADMVFTRMTGISASVSGNMIKLASGTILDISNFAGTTINGASIPDKYVNPAINITAAYARVNLDGGGVAFSTDGLNITKNASEQVRFWVEQANKSIRTLKGIKYRKVQLG